MNKEEKILADKKSEAFGLTVVTEKLCLQAMQEQAVAFAEWCESNYEKVTGNEWQHKYFENGKMDKIYTTADLYTLFNTNN
jgi:hypothetical protein